MVIFTSVFSSLSFTENALTLVLLLRLLTTLTSRNQQSEFIKQIVFVSAIDTLSTFILFWFGLIRVTGDETALLCAILANLTATFQSMSLCNITCICTFRYIIARNLRKHGAIRQSRFTLILIIVNTAVFVLGMSSFLATVYVNSIPEGTDVACEYLSTVVESARIVIGTIFYLSTVIFTIVSDTMCFLTILRLNREMNNVVPISTITMTDSSSTQQQGPVRKTVRICQRRAICTILLITLFINLSVLPLLCSFALIYAGVYISAQISRLLFLCMFLNSFCNPIIILVRIQDIRLVIKRLWDDFKTRFRNM